MAVTLNTTGITFSNGTSLSSVPVTAIATGNGLSGGTITSTGTLTLAAPGFNTVGSYALCFMAATSSITAGANYSAGSGVNQLQLQSGNGPCGPTTSNSLSGTWKSMTFQSQTGSIYTLLCVRVS